MCRKQVPSLYVPLVDCAADAEGSVDTVLVAIDPGRFALAVAEGSTLAAQRMERLTGYDR
jgi:hypothetical protein